MALVGADGIRFHNANFNVGADGTELGGEDTKPSRIGRYTGFPGSDVTQVWFDHHLARKDVGTQAGRLFQSKPEATLEFGVIFNSDH